MTGWPEHLAGTTVHRRRGEGDHDFRYSVDYVLIDAESDKGPLLFSRNRFNLASVLDRNHGGPRGQGRGAAWVRDLMAERGLEPLNDLRILLLTQPAFLGLLFNPVSFWLVYDGDDLRAVVAEVNNTFGDRHSYLCHKPGFAPITASDSLRSEKVMHVSPFQDIAGDYRFRFDIRPEAVSIGILHRNGTRGLSASLSGRRAPLRNRALLAACWRRPAGAVRTIVLIYWQALRLRLKGARYRTRPLPPSKEVT